MVYNYSAYLNFQRCCVRMKNILLASAIIFLLPGCSLLSPIKAEPVTTYVINTIPDAVSSRSTSAATLLVASPETAPVYNTADMAYSTQPYQIAYFAKNRWAATPGQMLQPLIVRSLQKTHYFCAVITTSTRGHYNYLLNTQILELQQYFQGAAQGQTSCVRLVIQAQVVNAANNQVIATKQFTATEFAPQNTPYGGVVAANKATAHLLNPLVNFCINAISQHPC